MGICIAGPFRMRTRRPGAQAKALPHYPPLRPRPVPSEGSPAPLLSSTTHSQVVLLPPFGRSCLPAQVPPPPALSLLLKRQPPHLRSALNLRPCTGSGLRPLPFRTQPPITSPLHRPVSNHVPSPLPQSISSAVLTPTDTRRPRRRRIYNCSLCTRGSWRGAVWVEGPRH